MMGDFRADFSDTAALLWREGRVASVAGLAGWRVRQLSEAEA